MLLILALTGVSLALPTPEMNTSDGQESRKVLGSRVVTSVSVIMDGVNNTKTYFSDAVGKPVAKPAAPTQLASPINLLNPDRYEFYTFDDSGDLVKRLMTLDEIQGIIASGDGEPVNYYSQSLNGDVPEERVDEVINNVQNVLKEEIQAHNPLVNKPEINGPDVSSTWNLILPAIFGTNQHVNNSLSPETVEINKETTVLPLTEKQQSETTVSNLVNYAKTESVTVLEYTSQHPEKRNISTESDLVASATTTLRVIPTTTHYVDITTLSPTTLEENLITPEDTVKSTTEQETTTYADEAPVTSTIQPSTSALELTKEVAQSTSYVELSTAFSTDQVFTLTNQVHKVESEETTGYAGQMWVTSAMQPFTIEQKEAVPETTTFVNALSSSTKQPSTLKTPLEENGITEPSNKNSTIKTDSKTQFFKEELTTEPFTIIPIEKDDVKTTTQASKIFLQNDFKISTLQEKTTPQFESTTATLTNNEEPVFATVSVTSLKSTERSNSTSENSEKSSNNKDFPANEFGSSSTADLELNSTKEVTTAFQIEEGTTINRFDVATEIVMTTERAKSDKTAYGTETNGSTTVFLTDPSEIETATTDVSVETTTEQMQTSLQIDKNMNDAVDSVISQMISQDVSQTTIENLAITTYDASQTKAEFSTTGYSLTDVSEKNRYEEIDLENAEVSTTIGYEGKNIPSLFEKLTTDNDLLTGSTESIGYVTYSTQTNTTIPIKNLKTDLLDFDYKFNHTKDSVATEKLLLTTSQVETTTQSQMYYITEFPSHVITTDSSASTELDVDRTTTETKPEANREAENLSVNVLSTTPISSNATKMSSSDVNVTVQPTTQTFVSIETLTPSSKLEKQPELHVINSVSSTTPKQDTTWALVSTVAPHKTTITTESDKISNLAVDLVPKPLQGFGLEDSTSSLEADVFQFTELCNELAFSFWNSVTTGISFARSVVVSPFATTSILAMVFLGARGATSGEMNDILKLDDMVTFNPHAIFKNVIESIEVSKKSGVAASVFVKELYSDKNKGKLLQFYKERVKQFYDGYVEEVNFKEINDIIRRRTNLLVKRQTWGKISEYLKDNSLFVRPPLAAVTANIFQTDCSQASTNGRDGELHFVVLPSIRQRKLVPIPAVVYRSGFLAGYEPGLDATAVAIGSKGHTVSTIFVIPGQQGISAPGDGLVRLETRLIDTAFKQNAWSRLLRSLIPRPGLEVQIPRFSHKSVINATAALQRMGLKDVFNSRTADLKGLNGIAHELYLSDIVQRNSFATCGEGRIDETHHSEIYPATTNRSFRRIRKIQNYHHQSSGSGDLTDEPRDYQRAFHDPLFDPMYLSLPLQFRPRQARLPDAPRLRFDRPFLYFVRHNPTGLILHMGRFNPRLLP